MTRKKIEETLTAERESLLARAKSLDGRAHRLTQASYAYDEATVLTQTNEECLRLDRLVRLSNRANEEVEILRDRAAHIETALRALESEANLSRPRQKAAR